VAPSRNHVAALDAASGTLDAWDPDANDWVGALGLTGGSVIAAGAFTGIGGSGRNFVAALDPGNGSLAWAPEDPMLCTQSGPDCLPGVDALAVAGGTIFAGGHGLNGRGTLTAIDAASGATLDWAPNPIGAVCALAADDSTLFVGGEFRTIAGEPQSFLAALSANVTAPVTGIPPGPVPRPRIALHGARPNPSLSGVGGCVHAS
jgi:outer membrane protein assembly factor BamB